MKERKIIFLVNTGTPVMFQYTDGTLDWDIPVSAVFVKDWFLETTCESQPEVKDECSNLQVFAEPKFLAQNFWC